MSIVAVNVALLQDGKILLTQREDFHVWCMPGGHLEDGETLPAAARREVKEELGLDVEIQGLVGIYSRPAWQSGLHIALFRGAITGGEQTLDPSEIEDVAWFELDALPQLLVGQRQKILDAAAGKAGVLRREETPYPAGLPNDRREVYRLRDASGLSRAAYYARTFGSLETSAPVEVSGQGGE